MADAAAAGHQRAVLIALGVWMGSWLTWVAVVLAHLGVLLILGVPILLLSTRWVIVVAIALTVLSDPINAWARSALAPAVSGSPIAAEDLLVARAR